MTTNTTPSTASQAPAVRSARDWPEDFKLENGNYYNICTTCRQEFMGYKRRFTCKVCAGQGAPSTPREAARHNVKTLTARTTELVGEVIAKGMLGVLEECIEMQLTINELEARATAAEAKLEAIRQGAEGLQEYSPAFKVIGGMAKSNDGGWLCKEELLALLQPQHQADESGLPG